MIVYVESNFVFELAFLQEQRRSCTTVLDMAGREALELQAERSLGPQDAMVYASVLRHLSATDTEPKCFLNRNSKDFLTRDIQDDLSRHDCRLISSFDDGRAYIERYAPA